MLVLVSAECLTTFAFVRVLVPVWLADVTLEPQQVQMLPPPAAAALAPPAWMLAQEQKYPLVYQHWAHGHFYGHPVPGCILLHLLWR